MVRAPDFDRQAGKIEQRLPDLAAGMLRRLRTSSPWLRWPAAIVLVIGGVAGFLPLLGFWMIPLGLILVARDLPFLRGPLARGFASVERKWPA